MSHLKCQEVENIIKEKQFKTFKEVHIYYRNLFNNSLSLQDKKCITTAIHNIRAYQAAEDRKQAESNYDNIDSLQDINNESCSEIIPSSSKRDNIMIVMAYSDDYTVGRICEKVNRSYADKYGYAFYSDVATAASMEQSILPKKHCTWYKIKLLQDILSNSDMIHNVSYLVWIDADAVVINHNISFIDLIKQHGADRELIIGEDMHLGCLINAGVFAIKVCKWSKDFLDDVWSCPWYDDVCFYEQSAMTKCLKSRGEGLELMKPFHSFTPPDNATVKDNTSKSCDDQNALEFAHKASADSNFSIEESSSLLHSVKLFPHVAVLPQHKFNSNIGVTAQDIQQYFNILQSHNYLTIPDSSSERINSNYSTSSDTASNQQSITTALISSVSSRFPMLPAEFIYHPAGKKFKIELIVLSIIKNNIEFDLNNCNS